MTNKPTDHEIDVFVQVCREKGMRELDVFQAVLTRWGQPAHSGEPGRRSNSACSHGCGAQGERMTPTHTLTGRTLDYAVGVAVNGVYSPAKADRKAGWFWPRTSIVSGGYRRIAPVFHDDPKWIPKLGQFAGKRMSLVCNGGGWTADLAGREAHGDTLQIALCRAIVLREIGPSVEVPDEYKE